MIRLRWWRSNEDESLIIVRLASLKRMQMYFVGTLSFTLGVLCPGVIGIHIIWSVLVVVVVLSVDERLLRWWWLLVKPQRVRNEIRQRGEHCG